MKKYLLILSFFFLGGVSAQTFAGEANLLQLIQTISEYFEFFRAFYANQFSR